MSRKLLGKIQKATLGSGGYDDAMFGLSLTFSLEGGTSGVCHFIGAWAWRSESASYTQEVWESYHLKAYMEIKRIMSEAKVNDLSKLVGVPIEVTFKDFNSFESFRVLTEVL